MTIGTLWLASVLAMALALATGCGKKPPAKSDPGTVTPPVNPVKDGTKPIPDKDGNSVPDFPKVEKPPAPLFDAVELTRKFVKEPDAANPLLNKQVRIEGVVAAVDLHPAGKDPDDARVTLYGSTDDPDQRKHVKVVCGLRDKAGAAKVGPGQKVTIQGSFLYAPPFVLLSEATVVNAGPVAVTQAEIERR